MIGVRDSVGLRPIGSVSVRDGGGLKSIATVRVRDSVGLKTVFESMSAVASEVPTAYGNSASPVNITTQFSVCTPEGGTPPYTYLWSEVTPPALSWTINFPVGGQGTTFTAQAVDPGGGDSAQFQCTVTDASGKVAVSNVIICNVVNLGGA